jgi:hypothetical protein
MTGRLHGGDLVEAVHCSEATLPIKVSLILRILNRANNLYAVDILNEEDSFNREVLYTEAALRNRDMLPPQKGHPVY